MSRYELFYDSGDGWRRIYDSNAGDPASFTDATRAAGDFRFSKNYVGGTIKLVIDGVDKKQWSAGKKKVKRKTSKKRPKSPANKALHLLQQKKLRKSPTTTPEVSKVVVASPPKVVVSQKSPPKVVVSETSKVNPPSSKKEKEDFDIPSTKPQLNWSDKKKPSSAKKSPSSGGSKTRRIDDDEPKMMRESAEKRKKIIAEDDEPKRESPSKKRNAEEPKRESPSKKAASTKPVGAGPAGGEPVDVAFTVGAGRARGGVARVEQVHDDGSVDVRYLVNKGREKRVTRSRVTKYDVGAQKKRSRSPRNASPVAVLSDHKKKTTTSATKVAKKTMTGKENVGPNKKKPVVVEKKRKAPVASPNKVKKHKGPKWPTQVSNRMASLLRDDADHGYVAEGFAVYAVIRKEAPRSDVLGAAWKSLVKAKDPRLVDGLTVSLDLGLAALSWPWIPTTGSDDVTDLVLDTVGLLRTAVTQKRWVVNGLSAALTCLAKHLDRHNLVVDWSTDVQKAIVDAVSTVSARVAELDLDDDEPLERARLVAATRGLAAIAALMDYAILKTIGAKLTPDAALIFSAALPDLHAQTRVLHKHPAAHRARALTSGTTLGDGHKRKPSLLDNLVDAILNQDAE